jgi:hypothetical protein
MPPRSEPLLWVQLIGVGLLPLEALLVLLLLAGGDPGPVPALERLLCWGLGGLAPMLLLWRRPADVWSLLLVQTPLRARRPLQQRLSRLQDALPPRIGLLLAAVASLPLLWWLDEHAAVAAEIAPLAGAPRLVLLLLAAAVLAVMLWQWQQLLQALWLFSRSPALIAAARPLGPAELEEQRICLGLPLLLLDPLQLNRAPSAAAPGPASPTAAAQPTSAPPSDTGSSSPAGALEPAPWAGADRSAGEPPPQRPDPSPVAADAAGADRLGAAAADAADSPAESEPTVAFEAGEPDRPASDSLGTADPNNSI